MIATILKSLHVEHFYKFTISDKMIVSTLRCLNLPTTRLFFFFSFQKIIHANAATPSPPPPPKKNKKKINE